MKKNRKEHNYRNNFKKQVRTNKENRKEYKWNIQGKYRTLREMHETRHKHVENMLKLGGIQQENAICKQWTNLVKKTLCNAKKTSIE